MYSMVATFNDNVLCTCKLLREEILNVLTTHTHTHTQYLCGVMEVLTNLIVIINSQQM